MSLKTLIEPGIRFLYAEIQKFQLRPIKKVNVQFDPFHNNAKTVRDILFHLSAKRVRSTNVNCVIKSEIVCDRSEPIITLDLHNGMNVLFKCGNLTPIEVAREFNHITTKYDVVKEEAPIKLKGALLDLRKRKR